MDKSLILALLDESAAFRDYAAGIIFEKLNPVPVLIPQVQAVVDKYKEEGKIPAIKFLHDLTKDPAIADYFIKAFPHCIIPNTLIQTKDDPTIGLALAKSIVEDLTKNL